MKTWVPKIKTEIYSWLHTIFFYHKHNNRTKNFAYSGCEKLMIKYSQPSRKPTSNTEIQRTQVTARQCKAKMPYIKHLRPSIQHKDGAIWRANKKPEMTLSTGLTATLPHPQYNDASVPNRIVTLAKNRAHVKASTVGLWHRKLRRAKIMVTFDSEDEIFNVQLWLSYTSTFCLSSDDADCSTSGMFKN
jgi:hypothetical protein